MHRFGGVRQQDRKGHLKVKAELYAKLCASRHWCMSRDDSVKVGLGLQVCVHTGSRVVRRRRIMASCFVFSSFAIFLAGRRISTAGIQDMHQVM